MRRLCILVVVTGLIVGCASNAKKESEYDPSKDEQFLTRVELSGFESAVAVLDYPLTFADAFKKMGGSDKLHWDYTVSPSYKDNHYERMMFSIVSPHLKGKGYVVAFVGENLDTGESLVTKVAVGYYTPLGGVYYADLHDASLILRDMNERANHSPEPTPGAVH